jgi:FixJ family two-component response regulator
VISAHANLRLEAEAMGVEGFLAKPVEAEKLVSTVTRYIH